MRAASYVSLPPDNAPRVLGVFTTDKLFYRSFFRLLLIVTLQQLAALTVNLLDNLMLGRYAELALSGASLVNQLQFSLQQLCAGVGMGIVVLSSQYWGQKRTGPIRSIIGLGMKCGLLAGLLFFAAAELIPHGLLSLFTNDEEVIGQAMQYLAIIAWTYPIFGLSSSLMYSLQAVETAAVGTVMSCSTIVVNFCLNSALIYGRFGAPELGIRGAAIATLVSRIIELIIVLVYILFIDKKLHMRARDLLRTDLTYLRAYLRTAMPIIITGSLWGVSQAAQTAVLGHISETVLAANSIAVILFDYVGVVANSSTNAASVIIGKTIGEGRMDMIKPYSRTLQVIFLLIGLAAGGMLMLLRGPLVSLYAVTDETRAMALNFCLILVVASIGGAYEYPTMSGIIAGGGSTRYAAVVDNLFIWCFAIPGAYLSAFVFRWSPLVTFGILKADQVLKCLPNAIKCNRYRWVHILTEKRTEEES